MQRPMTWRTKFDQLFEEMKPNLPRCRRINKKAFNQAGTDRQREAYIWLEAIYKGKYAQLRKLIKDIPAERWAFYKAQGWNDLEEIKLRKQYEEELRVLWEKTMPELLQRDERKSVSK